MKKVTGLKKKIPVKMLIRCLLFALSAAAFGNSQTATEKTDKPVAFKAGGTPIVIPTPTKDMVEVGDAKRELLEVLVPTSSRLLSAFLLTNDLLRLPNVDVKGMSKYALVEVSRRSEYLDCEPSNFKEEIGSVKAQFGDSFNYWEKEGEKEFNHRIKSLGLDKATLSLGKPIQLGRFFSKQDAYGVGVIMPVSTGSKTVKMGAGIALVRVKKRLLVVLLYSEYKNEQTVKWLRDTSEEWADAILNVNK
ncbi:MAG: hypothetical protein ABSF85_05675 [Terriglobales bacterium]|jgi:hypothetical protein